MYHGDYADFGSGETAETITGKVKDILKRADLEDGAGTSCGDLMDDLGF